MTEADLGPEPDTAEDGDFEAFDKWVEWCAKGVILRNASLKGGIECLAFYMGIEELRNLRGDLAVTAFVDAAFPRGSSAWEAGHSKSKGPWGRG